MDAGGRSQTNEQDRRACIRIWTKEDEETLLSIMDEIVTNGGCADYVYFKAGTLNIMESRLANILPNCGLRASPHIESKDVKGLTNQTIDNHYRPYPKKAALARLSAVNKSLMVAKLGANKRNRQGVKIIDQK
ncbi:hypothetical protein LWI28_014360 [Acer negundo]|uniref:Uncharacterized protein n=1 Tax=Acer negundo TaxID=4023 RepID=A0AAD5JKN3_ACENE|nr:hypothetical protein LWI28_014360 [Acer negundo]